MTAVPDPIAAIRPPEAVVEIARRLEAAGHETWCVGGAVRDAMLGHPDLDWDLATSATPVQVKAVFGRRTKPVGVEFGTVGVLDRNGRLHEVTTFRRDVRTDGRHAEVEFGASLDEDLARRDFTINAIAYHPLRRELRDPFAGREDLRRGVVRAVGEPGERMREDRLRALRALRFAGRFGFVIAPETWGAIRASAPHLTRLSAERVKQELEKTIEQVDRPARTLALWQESGALATLIPPLAQAWDPEAVAALDCLPRPTGRNARGRRIVRLAALFTMLEASTVAEVLRALRFSNADQSAVVALVERWRRLRTRLEAAVQGSDAEIRRLVAAIGRLDVAALLRLAAGVWASARARGAPAPEARAVHSLYRRLVRSAFRDPVELRDLAVDGDDLRRVGVPAGPVLGKILQLLLADVLEDPARNRMDWLLEAALRHWERVRGGRPE